MEGAHQFYFKQSKIIKSSIPTRFVYNKDWSFHFQSTTLPFKSRIHKFAKCKKLIAVSSRKSCQSDIETSLVPGPGQQMPWQNDKSCGSKLVIVTKPPRIANWFSSVRKLNSKRLLPAFLPQISHHCWTQSTCSKFHVSETKTRLSIKLPWKNREILISAL